jgi:hypothetical protein
MKNKYNRFNVYNNAVKNLKMFKLTFNQQELNALATVLRFNLMYSKMYKHIAQNLNYNFHLYLSPIVLNSYQVDGLKDCIENYIKKVKPDNTVYKNMYTNLVKLINRS